MKLKKFLSLAVGIVAACALLVGIVFIFASKGISVAGGIVIICLSLASGLIFPNPISFWGLIAGVCVLVFPPYVVGIVFAVLGVAGMLTNVIISKRTNKVSVVNT